MYFNSQSFTSTDTSNRQGSSTWELLDPYGTKIFWNVLGSNNSPNDAGRFTLPNTGTYTLVVQGLIDDGPGTSTYKFNVVPVTDTTTALSLNTQTTGAVAMPGQHNNYTFTLTAATALWFSDGLVNNNNLNWQLSGPAGVVDTIGSFEFANLTGLLQPGAYTLTINGTQATVGSYAFNLMALGNRATLTTTLTAGSTAGGTLNATTPTRLFTFTASPGDVYTLHNLTVSANPNAYWLLLDPWGKQITGGGGSAIFGDLSNISLQAAGTYTIVTAAPENSTTATTTFTFQLVNVSHNPPVTTGTTIDLSATTPTTYSSTIGQSGEADYQFTLANPTRVWFDSLTNNSASLIWQVSGPQGFFINQQNFGSQLQFNASDQNLGLLQPGTYSLKITGAAGTAYAFRLLNQNLSTGIVPSTASVRIAESGELDATVPLHHHGTQPAVLLQEPESNLDRHQQRRHHDLATVRPVREPGLQFGFRSERFDRRRGPIRPGRPGRLYAGHRRTGWRRRHFDLQVPGRSRHRSNPAVDLEHPDLGHHRHAGTRADLHLHARQSHDAVVRHTDQRRRTQLAFDRTTRSRQGTSIQRRR